MISMRGTGVGILGVSLLACLPLGAAPAADYASVQRKFDSIESGRLKPGSRVHLSAAELNVYVAHQAPAGVRQTRLVLLRPEVAQGNALIDFAEVKRAQGDPPGWLMAHLLEGERPVSVTARIHSAGGKATVDVLSVQISGLTIDGSTLDFLIRHILLPMYPNAAVGRPFELGDHIEKIDVQPAGVAVIIGQ
jgi:hypothetical protein